MPRRPLLLAAAALACAAAARQAAAQAAPQVPASVASVAVADGAPLASATRLAAGPSLRDRTSADAERAAALHRELRAATMQRRSGQALVLAGGVGLGAAYAGYVGSGAMGMNGGQAALFAGGSAVLAGGITRWVAGRHRAERARTLAVAAGRR